MKQTRTIQAIWLFSLAALLVWSSVHPLDRFVWWVEALPAIVGVSVLGITHRRFQFTRVVYIVVWIHAVVVIVAAHYTYAETPLFNWLRDALHLSRNDYDRVGHFLQGFSPALIARELLLRTSPLRRGKWMFFIVACICLALSAFYEMIEWWAAVAAGTDVDVFLGTQGDPWDTEWDMLVAACGAILAQFALAGVQDRQLSGVPVRESTA